MAGRKAGKGRTSTRTWHRPQSAEVVDDNGWIVSFMAIQATHHGGKGYSFMIDGCKEEGLGGGVGAELLRRPQSHSSRVYFDGEETDPIPIKAGVPQGSPLSPILFIL